MRLHRLSSTILAGAALLIMVLATTSQASTPYNIGFTWNRWADWKPGATDGSSAGNPCKDSAGNPVWSAEYILNVPAGSDLDTSDGVAPWYTLPTSGLMVWDSHWSDYGTWAKLYDTPPAISRYGLGHVSNDQSYNGDHYANVPLLRWKNPSAERLTVSLTPGSSRFSGVFGYMPTGSIADLMIGWTDASDGDSVHSLYSTTMVKTAAADVRESIVLPELAINALVLDPGDNIIFSVRSRTRTTGFYWASANFYDDVNITVVPEPGAMILLATGLLGLLAYAWHCRRS